IMSRTTPPRTAGNRSARPKLRRATFAAAEDFGPDFPELFSRFRLDQRGSDHRGHPHLRRVTAAVDDVDEAVDVDQARGEHHAFRSPLIRRERTSLKGRSSTSRTLSKVIVNGPRVALPYWRTLSTLSTRPWIPLYCRFEM